MQIAAANGDFITPAVISAAEADYERNLANTDRPHAHARQ